MKDITDWLREFIKEFRKQSEKLSKEEKSRISNLDNFFSPCQILVLWFQEANLQFLICTHDKNRKDIEIDVEGPIATYEAIDIMDSILKDPKWNRELSQEEKKYVHDKTTSFAAVLENQFLAMIRQIRNQPFLKPPETTCAGGKRWVTSESFLWTILGNIAEMDNKKIVAGIIDLAKKEVTRAKTKPTISPPPKPKVSSCATYFYPPIWIGKRPRKTFIDRAIGSFIMPKKALDLEYKGRIIVVNQDGLVAIGEENIGKATRMLNEIMATSLLMGLEANAVRELEVCDAEINPSLLTIISWGTRAYTLRTQLAEIFPPKQLRLEDRIEVTKESLKKIIRQSERISKDPDISDFLTFFLQAQTHLKNSEYSQSFIMSWVIIERQMLWLWRKFLKEERMPRKRRDKLTNPAYWTTDFVIEGLNLGGQLSEKEYKDLMNLKSKRNDIIHLGESTTLEEAEKCFKIAKNIVKQRSNLT